MTTKVVTDFGTILRSLRENLGLTLRTVAEQVGKSTTYLSDVEKGLSAAPKGDTLKKILAALQCPERYDELYELAILNRTTIHTRLRPRDPSNAALVALIDKYAAGKLTDYDRQLLSCIDP